MRATRSTVRCTGALLPCACCTILMICARAVCSPICCALNLNLPCETIVPASTFAPFCLRAGVGSPVIMLSSTYAPSVVIKLSACVTSPSTGTFSPARTSRMSPRLMVAMGTSCSSSPSTSRAVFGARPISCRMLPAVSSLARSSSSRPVSTKVIIITETSKYVCHWMPRAPQTASPQKVLKVLKRKAMPVDRATSESILADP